MPTSQGLYLYNGTDIFGSSCATWDAFLVGLCQAGDPACQSLYCYVDPSNCSTASYPSVYFRGMDLQYSYLSCGYQSGQDSLTEQIRGQLAGKTYTFAYPASSRPWHYEQDGDWTGSVASFFKKVANSAQFQTSRVPVSDASLSLFASPWDACVHDVQMQLIDFCISVIMETDTRRQMATFSSPIMAGNMKLMVRKQVYDNRWDPSLGFKSVWFSWLQPFSPFLWLLVGLLVIAAGIAFYWAEEAPETGCCSEGPWTSVKTGVSQGTLSFFAGGDLGDTKTRAGMWIRVGFAVFSMVMLASYTANLATMLVIDAQQSAGISGIKDCDPPSDICQKVCVISQQLNLVRAQHPTMDVVIFQNSGDLAQGLVDGDCQAAIVPEHDVNARSDYQETMCENGFHLVGDAVFTVYVGFAARSDLINALSYHTLQLVYQGEFLASYEQFRYKMLDTCLEDSASSEDEEVQLTAVDMAGVCIVFSAFLFLGVIARFLKKAHQKVRRSSLVAREAELQAPQKKEPELASETSLTAAQEPNAQEPYYKELQLQTNEELHSEQA